MVLDIRKRIIHDEFNQIFTLSIEGLGTLIIGLQTSFVMIVLFNPISDVGHVQGPEKG